MLLIIHLIIYIWEIILGWIIALGPIASQSIDRAASRGDINGSANSPSADAFYSINNSNGGRVWVSNREIFGYEVKELYEKFIDSKVSIVSGVHGDAAGNTRAELYFLWEDLHNCPGADVINYNEDNILHLAVNNNLHLLFIVLIFMSYI